MGKIVLEEEKSIDRGVIEDSIKKFKDEYKLDEVAVEKVFKLFDNSSEENIFIRTVILNDRYSAGLNRFKSNKEHIAIDVGNMAKRLYAFSERLDTVKDSNDLYTLIKDISEIKDKNRPVSFLSKYLHWNYYVKDNNIRIPIFDKYTRGMILKLSEKLDDENVVKKDLSDYEKFCKRYFRIMDCIMKKYSLTEFNVKKFDMFLWYYGKNNGIYLE